MAQSGPQVYNSGLTYQLSISGLRRTSGFGSDTLRKFQRNDFNMADADHYISWVYVLTNYPQRVLINTAVSHRNDQVGGYLYLLTTSSWFYNGLSIATMRSQYHVDNHNAFLRNLDARAINGCEWTTLIRILLGFTSFKRMRIDTSGCIFYLHERLYVLNIQMCNNTVIFSSYLHYNLIKYR